MKTSRKSAAGLPASDRRRIINTLFVERPHMLDIVQRLDRLREDHREDKETACMILVGDPGVGKSRLLKRYRDANPIVEERSDVGVLRRQPVVYAELEPNTTVILAAETILKAMMGDGAPSGSRVKDDLLPRQLLLRRTELLIVDEFQHVAERGATKTRSRTADWVKSITKKLRIPVVMAGIPSIQTLVEENAQLDSITPYRFMIPHYDFAETAAQKGFRDFLAAIDRQLPFDRTAKLDAPDRAASLHLASGGNLRYLGYILSEAGRIAIDDDAYCITDNHLFGACEEVEMHPDCPGNPFDPGLDGAD